MAAAVPSLTAGPSPFPNQSNQTSGLEVCAGMAMTDPNSFWQRTFPDSEPGTDGVALFDGRVIGRVRYHQLGSRDPVWRWSVTDLELAGRPGWADTHGEMPSRRQAMDRLIELAASDRSQQAGA
jgi:hypothetical protein